MRVFDPAASPSDPAPHCWPMPLPVIASIEGIMNDTDAVTRAGLAKKGSPFLNTEQAAFYLGICPRRLQALRSDGSGPRFRRHSRYVRYHIDDLDLWSRDSAKEVHHG
jgi:hypothetical protein